MFVKFPHTRAPDKMNPLLRVSLGKNEYYTTENLKWRYLNNETTDTELLKLNNK
jgi:hypothetical protein